MGNTSLFDDEDEMNMSMESGVNARNSGFMDKSPTKTSTTPPKKNSIKQGLTEAVMEVDEEDEPKN